MNWWLIWIETTDGKAELPQVVAAKYPHMAILEMREIAEGETINILNVAIDLGQHRQEGPVMRFDHEDWLDFMDQQRRRFPDRFKDNA